MGASSPKLTAAIQVVLRMALSSRDHGGAIGGRTDVEDGRESRDRLVTIGDGGREFVDLLTAHQGDGTAAETRSRHADAEAGRVRPAACHHDIQLPTRYGEVVTQAV